MHEEGDRYGYPYWRPPARRAQSSLTQTVLIVDDRPTFVVSERAVEKHVTSIFGKLALAPAPADHRRVLAALAYLRG